MMDFRSLTSWGILFIILGFILTFVGIFLNSVTRGSNLEGGGIVMIGPIPIAFGTSSGAITIAMILAVLIMILWLIGIFALQG